MRQLGLLFLFISVGCGDGQGQVPTPDGGNDSGSRFRMDGQIPLPDFLFPDGSGSDADVAPTGADRCESAPSLSLATGSAVVASSTAALDNEYGISIRCGLGSSLAGPQRYQRVALDASSVYRFDLTPEFDSYLMVITSCGPEAINADCTSDGSSGDLLGPIPAGTTGKMFFFPPATSEYLIVVESVSVEQRGDFVLNVREVGEPINGRCPNAELVTFNDGLISIDGSTAGAINQFPETPISCSTGHTFRGPQVYYSVDLEASQWYRFELTPEFPAGLYVTKDAACDPELLVEECASERGTVLPLVAAGETASTVFRPEEDGAFLVAVDSQEITQAGDFELAIETFSPPDNMVCESSELITLVNGQANVAGDTSGYFNDTGASRFLWGAVPVARPTIVLSGYLVGRILSHRSLADLRRDHGR